MKKIQIALFFLLFNISYVYALQIEFDGYLNYHNDIKYYNLNVLESGYIDIYTDSYFGQIPNATLDPVLVLWNGDDGQLLYLNDAINTTGGDYNAEIYELLDVGNYIVTLTAYDNFPYSNNLSDGFYYDGENPIPISLFIPEDGPPLPRKWIL